MMGKNRAPILSLIILAGMLAACGGTSQVAIETGVPIPTKPLTEAAAAVTQTLLPHRTETPPLSSTAVPQSPPILPTAVPTITAVPATPSPTATAVPETISFAVVGDYGLNVQGAQDVAALVESWNPDLVLTVGDNNYPDGAAHTIEANAGALYGRFIAGGRFFPTLGNHDMTTENGQPYLDYFELPGNERYYDFVQGDLHFFALNSDWREPDGIRADSRQAQWLQERLAASTAAWQIVYLHVPPYVSMADKEVPVLRWPFAAWGADLVLSGHAHLYERLHVNGIPYVVNGLGGTVIYPFDETAVPGSQERFNDDFGALLVEGGSARLRGQFVTRTGAVVDSFVLE